MVVYSLRNCLISNKLFISVIICVLIMLNHFEVAYHLARKCGSGEAIDVVYTWVNGTDAEFRRKLNFYLKKNPDFLTDSSKQRYDDKNELKYSLRSLEKYANWVNHVYIVTNGQIPSWLDMDYEKVTLITHDQIFPDKNDLPTFSSPAIESHLHRIPGLSENFIYFNDDIFAHLPIYREDFISPGRGFLIYLAWLVPKCAIDCSWVYVADGNCDEACNNPNCQMDGGDCATANEINTPIDDNIVQSEKYLINPELDHLKVPRETFYQKILANLNITGNFNITNYETRRKIDKIENKSEIFNKINFLNKIIITRDGNVSEIVKEHNDKLLLKRKLIKRAAAKKIRRNIDAYAASLQYTNRILNHQYGFSVRKVPSHAPILINKNIMRDAADKFKKHFEITSRNRFRSSSDVQFSFLYYYFVIHEKLNVSMDEIFNYFDTDSSGDWSDIEMETIIAQLFELPITDGDVKDFLFILHNCTKKAPNSNENIELPSITKSFVKSCDSLSAILNIKFGRKHKYHYDIVKNADARYVMFKMINSNVTDARNQLNDIRKNPKKFVCLNDNLDSSRPSNNYIIRFLMLDLYEAFFPNPSSFELPKGYQNRYLNVEEHQQAVKAHNQILFVLFCLLVLVIVRVFYHFFRRKVVRFVNWFFY